MASRAREGVGRHRRIAIRDKLVLIMRAVEPTPFAAEGPARAGLRGALCLDGWPWSLADAEAELIVGAALTMAGAKRPTWKEGQPEWTQDGHAPLTRERCKRCAKPLPPENFVYCGSVCAQAAKNESKRRWDLEQQSIAELSGRAIKQKCASCGSSFSPRRKGQQFCSPDCAYDARRPGGRAVRMVCQPV